MLTTITADDPATEAFRVAVRAFARETLAPRVKADDASARFPIDAMRAAARLGLTGMTVPAAFGGSGKSLTAYATAVRELAAVDAGTTVGIMVSNLAASCITRFGNDLQKQKYLPGLCDLSLGMGSFCLSESSAASAAARMATTATLDGNHYGLNGRKMWITNGSEAGVFVVMAVTHREAGARGISAFVVERGTRGLSTGKPEEKLGQHTSNTVAVTLEECRVPVANLLGAQGDGFKVAMSGLDSGRVGVAAQANGIAMGIVEALRALLGPEPSSRASAEISRFERELDAAWLLIMRAAALVDAGQRATKEASMAKLFATESANRIARLAHDLAPHAAIDTHDTLSRALRDLRVTTIYEGTSEVQRIVIARDLLAAGSSVARSALASSAEHDLLASAVRDLATKSLAPSVLSIDHAATVPTRVTSEVADRGLFAVTVSEIDGGAGMDAPALALACETLAETSAALAARVATHNALLAHIVARASASSSVTDHLKDLITGRATIALVDGASAATPISATKHVGGWRLTGSLDVFGAADAHVLVVTARTGERPACFVIAATNPGVTVERHASPLGLRGFAPARITFRDAALEEWNLILPGTARFAIGAEATSPALALPLLDVAFAAISVGLARAAHRLALAYAQERVAFGKPIAEYQAIQWKLVDAATETDAAALMVARAATACQPTITTRAGVTDEAVRIARAARLFAAQVATSAAYESIQILGGYGYTREVHVERFYRDARTLESVAASLDNQPRVSA